MCGIAETDGDRHSRTVEKLHRAAEEMHVALDGREM